jgi:serine/threonine protein kinase/Flp pilus assembly protein TadD
MSDGSDHDGDSLESLVAEVADEFLARRRRGERPDAAEFAARHPQHAALLGEVLDALRVAGLSDEPVGEPAVEELGDFRLLREVGRGGMGVVYEATQLSLNRRVALKVLPAAATLDPSQFRRFRNEARAAALLHHANIVPVYGIGCERGVHFYAMQFIEGRTLAEVVRDARPGASPPAADTVAGLATERPESFRAIARLGLQAAEALEHAHQEGVVHRDIKPANLILDGKGNLWVTDFGLARLQDDAGLTTTGGVVGTLRYMSPEQASGRPGAVDHRTDVYSLGATLYELLTREPVFDGHDRGDLLRRISTEEPRPPRKLNPAVPVELQVIIGKALEKEPTARYASARELADDLRRFLEDKPIRARPPSRLERARKWSRRHRPAVWSATAALLVTGAVLAGSVGWVVRDRAARHARAADDVAAAVREAQLYRGEGKWPEALALAKQAETLLNDCADEAELAGRVKDLLRELAEEAADRRLVADLGDIRSRRHVVNERETSLSIDERIRDYRQAFTAYGFAPGTVTTGVAVARIRSRPAPLASTMLAALDHWLILARHRNTPEVSWLAAVLDDADADPWRKAVRVARGRNDRQTLVKLAREADVAAQPTEALFVLAQGLRQRAANESAVDLLRRACDAFPGDFWINHDLGITLLECRPPRYEESVRYLTAAVALRPDSPQVRADLGFALWGKGQTDEAAETFRQAIAMKPDFAETYGRFGDALAAAGRPDDAVDAFRKTVALNPNFAEAHRALGGVLWGTGRREEAIAAYRKAAELKPDCAELTRLGSALLTLRRLDEATPIILRAVELNPDSAEARHALGNALNMQGRFAEAADEQRKAVELKPDYAEAHCDLGIALWKQGDYAAALPALRRGHELGSARPIWPYPSAKWVKECELLIKQHEGRP